MKEISTATNQSIAAGQYSREEKFWLEKFSGDFELSTFYREYLAPSSGQKAKASWEFKITGDLFTKLMKIVNQSDFRLHIIMVSGLVLLLNKYTTQMDITIGTPVLKQEVDAEFINTVLPLKNRCEPHMTFKELLLQVRQTIVDATEHQNYPYETLLYQLAKDTSDEDVTLFDAAILLENIHDESYIRHTNPNIQFRFNRTEDSLDCVIDYNEHWHRESVEQIGRHYQKLLEKALGNLDSRLADIDILTEKEKYQLLNEYNETDIDFPKGETINGFFRLQVEKIPHHTAIVFQDQNITYSHLGQLTDHLARKLTEKRIKPDTLVGIMSDRSPDMVIGILAIIKAGGAYLPIDPVYPAERIQQILDDSNVSIVLTQSKLESQLGTGSRLPEIIKLDEENKNRDNNRDNNQPETSPPDAALTPENMLYVIYTSGSTGKPKGVKVNHKSFANLVQYHRHLFKESAGTRMSLVAGLSFDAMAFELWPCLCNGATLNIASEEIQTSPHNMKEWLLKNQVEITYQPTIMAEMLMEQKWTHRDRSLKTMTVAGDRLTQFPTPDHSFKLYNLYGPTEGTVWTTWARITHESKNGNRPPIGKPVGNNKVYVLGSDGSLLPKGAAGELYIGGEGVAMGYLNRKELTEEKFVPNPYIQNQKMYRTGDLVRWQPDGQLQFIGRRDQQVKIRGFRIELGEIEHHLLKHEDIKKAVVIIRQDGYSEKYICAYYVSDNTLKTAQLREHMATALPEYMIPRCFQQIDQIPLTENGKVNRKQLPEPEINSEEEYIPPRDEVDEKLIQIWEEVLEIEKERIGIDSDFFALGGHSLRATIVVSMVHKTFDVKIPLVEIFKTSTIRELSDYIKTANKDVFESIALAPEKASYPLSSAQKRLYVVQQMEKDNMSYNVMESVILEGKLDKSLLEQTFRKLVHRHESLRTIFQLEDDKPVQKILPPEDVDITFDYYEAAPGETDEIVKNYRKPFALDQAPLMRIGLIKEEEEKHIMMVEVHHIAADGTSMGILLKEFMELYDGKELSPLTLQYKDYSEWQSRGKQEEALQKQEAYWLNRFKENVPALNLPLNGERTADKNFSGSYATFDITEADSKALKEYALKEETTLFNVLLTAYYVMLAKLGGQEDITIGTINAGRRHSELDPIVGMFVNTLALRNKPSADKTIKEFLNEVNHNTLEAFENMDYQFEDLVDKVAQQREPGRNPLFDVMIVLQNLDISTFTIPGINIKPYPLQTTTTKFDLNLLCYDSEKQMRFTLQYNTSLFSEETIQLFVTHFKGTLNTLLKNPGKKISEISILSGEEENMLMDQMTDDLEDE
jgi:amino acid adenylation domain-containing protein